MEQILSLIKTKLEEIVGYPFNQKDIQKNISEYVNVLIYDKIKHLSDNILNVSNDEEIEIKYDVNKYKLYVKIQNMNKPLSMPNLISIDKARKILSNDNNNIIYIFIQYVIENDFVKIINYIVEPIERLNWDCLGIQNIGKGQLYLKNTSSWKFFKNSSRKEWIDKLIEIGKDYYEELILKVFEYKNNWLNEQ